MKLTIFGTNACANCKTILSMAKAKGLDPEYTLIDSSEEVEARFRATVESFYGDGASIQLPLVLVTDEQIEVAFMGLKEGINGLTFAKQVQEIDQ